MRSLLTAFAIVFLMACFVNAQEGMMHAQETQKVALESIATFSKLVNRDNYKQMGFESLAEVKSAILGQPIHDSMVRLDQLQKYQEGSDPATILSGTNEVLYPVMVKEQVRSSITIANVDGSWKATSFGGPAFIKLVTKVQKQASENTSVPVSSYFIVRVPALNLYFLGYRLDDKLMLIPLQDGPQFEFKAGVSMPAEKVFTTIVPAAREHNGLPR